MSLKNLENLVDGKMKNSNSKFYEEKILENARQYARICFNNFFIENGVMNLLSSSDKKNYEDLFLNNIKMFAKDYLASLTAECNSEGKLIP